MGRLSTWGSNPVPFGLGSSFGVTVHKTLWELALERVEYLLTSKVDLDTETLYITNAYHIPFTHQSPPLQSRPLSTTIS